MSDDEADPELLALLRERLGLGPRNPNAPPDTKVLKSAEFIADHSIDVALDMRGTKAAAEHIWNEMQRRDYTTKAWADHELHPTTKDETTVNFIFTMDLLNYSFWSEKPVTERFAIEYQGKRWTGYMSLVAALRRALDEEIPITSPEFWDDEDECTKEKIHHVFRSCTNEEMPLLDERLVCLKEAGRVICDNYKGKVIELVAQADHSAARLVNLLSNEFLCFHDVATFEKKEVFILKRAQILVADLWAAFEGQSFGEFHDINKITMFADYRVPQMLHSLGCLYYSPPLDSHIRQLKEIACGHSWELQLRGCSIWGVEKIRQEIVRNHPDATVNAILIDFFLYDTMKEREAAGEVVIPHHRTRSIWY